MKKKLLALFLALVMVGAVLPGCGDGSKDPGGQGNNGETGEPVKGGEITVGIAQDLDDSLDPHQTVAAGTREVLFNIFEGLVKPNSDGEMIPAVAEKYELSEDGTTYTFTLRDGVKFHNGQTVTAEDVVYSINRCAAVPEGQEKPLVAAFSAVRSVEALDEKTVTVTIAQRDLEFISYMTVAIIPAGYADSYPRSLSNRGAYAVINGVKCPQIGRICMDMCMFDVTDAEVKRGDETILYGKGGMPMEEIAALAGSINCEPLCLLTNRVKKIYV